MSAKDPENKAETAPSKSDPEQDHTPLKTVERPKEIGGRGGLDPTRYGDWEKSGRCIDF
jgi:hypothetical protein